MRLFNYINEVKLKDASEPVVVQGLPMSQEDRNMVLNQLFGKGKWEIQDRDSSDFIVVYDKSNKPDMKFAKKRKLTIIK